MVGCITSDIFSSILFSHNTHQGYQSAHCINYACVFVRARRRVLKAELSPSFISWVVYSINCAPKPICWRVVGRLDKVLTSLANIWRIPDMLLSWRVNRPARIINSTGKMVSVSTATSFFSLVGLITERAKSASYNTRNIRQLFVAITSVSLKCIFFFVRVLRTSKKGSIANHRTIILYPQGVYILAIYPRTNIMSRDRHCSSFYGNPIPPYVESSIKLSHLPSTFSSPVIQQTNK